MADANLQNPKWFSEKILPQLNDDQRYWLALIAFRLIYADTRIDRREIDFLDDLSQCLNNNSFLTFVFTKAAFTIDISKMPNIEFSDNLKTHIFGYLSKIAISDQNLHPKEFVFLQEIANSVNYPLQQLKATFHDLGIDIESIQE